MTAGYRAAREGAAWADRSDRTRMTFGGAKAAETLNGILTNEIVALRPGSGCYAAALTPRGKVVADVRVFAREGSFVVDTSPAAGAGFVAMIRKYVNPRLASYRDLTTESATIAAFGPAAAGIIADVCGIPEPTLRGLAPYAHAALSGVDGFVARARDMGVDEFDIFVPPTSVAGISEALSRAGVMALDRDTLDVLRVEAGRPFWGPDMNEDMLAQEAALDRADLAAISFDKGCYTGQETVARVHFRGHVNRVLRGLRADAPLERGMTLHGPDGAQVGDVRSAVVSPRFGAIALAYVRREVADGSPVATRRDEFESTATVTALPFA